VAGAGSHSTTKVGKVLGLTWDPLTVVDDTGASELAQILYDSSSAVRTIVAADSASDSSLLASGSRAMPDLTVVPTLDASFDTASFENEFFIAGLGVLKRVAAGDLTYGRWTQPAAGGGLLRQDFGLAKVGLRILAHGMPADSSIGDLARRETLNMEITTRVLAEGAPAGVALQPGVYFYWWTWYNPLDDIEGPSNFPGQIFTKGLETAVEVAYISTTGLNEIWVTWRKSIMDAQIPHPGARIRLYRSLRYSTSALGATPGLFGTGINVFTVTVNVDQWPIGYLVGEFSLSGTLGIGGVIQEVVQYPHASTSKLQLRQFSDGINRYVFRNENDFNLTNADTTIANLGHVARTPFEFVSVRIGGKITHSDRDGEPPKSSAFEVFDESVVGNDPDDPRKTRFSFPGRPHSWPGVFFINHESKESDRVVAYRVMRNLLVVLLRRGVDRVNWLPRQSDFDFSRGRVRETISSDRGCVGVHAVDKFLHPTFGELVVFVSDDGVWVTDAIRPQLKELTKWVDWAALVGDPNACLLVDDPANQRLLLAHTQPGGEATPGALTALHYGEEFLDQSGLPAVIGPVERVNGVVSLKRVVTASGRFQVVSTDKLGSVFYEEVGFVDESTATVEGAAPTALPMVVRTAQIYPAGPLGEVEIGQVGIRARGTGSLTARTRSFIGRPGALPKVREVPVTPSSDPVSVGQGNIAATRYEVEFEGEGDIEVSHFSAMLDPSVGERE